MRLWSFVLRCPRWIAPLINDSGKCLRAEGVKSGRLVSGVTYPHCREVLNRNGDAAVVSSVGEEFTKRAGNWLRGGLDVGSVLESAKLKAQGRSENGVLRAQPLNVKGDSSEYPESDKSICDIRSIAVNVNDEIPADHMGEHGCQNVSGAGDLKSGLLRPTFTDNMTLKIDSDGVSRGGNDRRGFRGVRDQGQIDDSRELGPRSAVSSCQTGEKLFPSGSREGRVTSAKDSIPVRLEVSNDVHVDSHVVGLGSQMNVGSNVTIAAVANSNRSEEIEPEMTFPVGAPENGEVSAKASEYPVPLTPFSGEIERAIEYQRAMVAEAAMKSSPAISRNDIIFEDEWLMVINKPCGIYSEHVLATIPSLLHITAPLASESSPQDENGSTHETHLHMANRLDRDTSGVMVITKCKQAAGKMSRIFTNRKVQKSYIALCTAPPPTWKHLTIESGHGRSRFGAWRVYAKRDIGRGLPGKCVVRDMTTHFMVVSVNNEIVAELMDCGGIPAGCSSWEDLKSKTNVVIAGEELMNEVQSEDALPEGAQRKDSLTKNGDEVIIRAFPFTGRTHQIRLHCQYIGMPLRGDVKYGGPHVWDGVQYDHHALHAETLSFRHPFTSQDLFLVAPLPQWAKDAGIQSLQASSSSCR
ncbi:hypothetical protein MPTK1_2g25430 [Marchantia polymorpha subsp. ruderalis]|nr:hypothetical protein MARPO_0025s0135 [Marchantia polymorpha]BBN03677.1 hypothetical protein Mp_2g25430 [Marchantia polymorpha subsp. ruderalis]|eukprot:PTQ43455.1 hypothetical protein MARPO_0025s0135 [Marchantia polymorpha]